MFQNISTNRNNYCGGHCVECSYCIFTKSSHDEINNEQFFDKVLSATLLRYVLQMSFNTMAETYISNFQTIYIS